MPESDESSRDAEVEDRLYQAQQALADAEGAWNAELSDTVVISCLYYACLHAAQAVLSKHGHEPDSPGSIRSLFGSEVGVIDDDLREHGHFLNHLSELREQADHDYGQIDEDIDPLLSCTRQFISKMESILEIEMGMRPNWYDDTRGVLLGSLLASGTLLSILISTGQPSWLIEYFPPLGVEVPIDVYLFGFLGAASYALLWFSEGWPQDNDSESRRLNAIGGVFSIPSRELKLFTIRLIAALCLSTGIFLAGAFITGVIPVIESAPPTLAVAGTAFLVGFFVDRAYRTLGAVTSRITSQKNVQRISGRAVPQLKFSIQSRNEKVWTISLSLLSAFSIFIAVFLTVNWGTEGPPFLPISESIIPTTTIPFEVYLYGFIGSMGYIFTNLFEKFDRSYRSVCKHLLRVPIGPLFAGGFFLVTDFLFLGGTTASTESIDGVVSGFSFLIGLYPDAAIASLDAIAGRLFGKNTDG